MVPRRAASLLVVGLVMLAGCGSPAPSLPAPQCQTLGVDVRGLEWSQRGTFLAIAGDRPDGTAEAQVRNANGTAAAAPVADPGLDGPSITVSATGRLAWLEGSVTEPFLVEDGPDGRRRVELPEGSVQLHWTAIGYAVLQEEQHSGPNRILIIDPDRPDEPTVLHEFEFGVPHFWISADPETLLLTKLQSAQEIGFEVIGATTSQFILPPGADLSGASMPELRRHVVYRSEVRGRMVAVRVDDPSKPVVLTADATRMGRISDVGILAYVPVEPAGSLCLVDVSALLP